MEQPVALFDLTSSETSPANRSDVSRLGPEAMKERIYRNIRPDLDRIEAEIRRQLTTSIPLIEVVSRYVIDSGGKRLRPLMMILTSRLCGYRGNDDAPLAVVFEFVHAASLLHDDVVDSAEVRRNQPSANTVWNNPAVVLVGDFLYSKSILMAVAYQSVDILRVLTTATTLMSEGEVLQLIHADDLEVEEAEYLEVIYRKTAVLMSAACEVGAIFGGADEALRKIMRDFGKDLGMAFQLIDDTLDYTGEVEELGKPVGNDIQAGKATLPLLYTMKHCSDSERKELRTIFSADEIRPEDFKRVRELVTNVGGIDFTQRLALDHIRRAREALEIFPDQPAKQTLLDIADFVICRRM